MAALLAVLKAGKIYAPVDPALGSARISSLLADLQAELLMTNNRNLAFSPMEHRLLQTYFPCTQ
jgi:non-ribosomal peptide synthetase component F